MKFFCLLSYGNDVFVASCSTFVDETNVVIDFQQKENYTETAVRGEDVADGSRITCSSHSTILKRNETILERNRLRR